MRLRHAVLVMCLLAPANAFATQVKEVVSDKGFKAWLVEEHAQPLVAIKITFKDSGSSYDPSGKEGRANMAAALLMEGAGDLDARAFSEALENLALRMNTDADIDRFNASMEALSEHKDKAFYYLGLALSKPRFDNDSIARVKSQTQSIIREQESQPGYKLYRAWAEMAYGKHPYAKIAVGTKETVDNLSKGDLQDYVSHYLSKENIVIAVVGDITESELKTLMDKHFSNLPDKYRPDSKVEEATLPTQANTKLVDFDVPQTMVTFGTQGLKRNDPDYFNAYVMNQILGGNGSLTSLLGKEIREKRGLAYTVFSGLDPMTHGAVWKGGFATRNDQVNSAVEALRATLKDFVERGPSMQEFNDAKEYLKGSFVLNLDSNEDIAAFLINMQVNQLGIDYLDKRNQMVDAVTKEGVEDIARRIVDPDKLLVVMVGKPKPADNH